MNVRHTIRSREHVIDPTTGETIRAWTVTDPWGRPVTQTSDYDWALHEANRQARHMAWLMGLVS